ncbi:Tyrosine protein kinase:Serine/threonine protein kinase [[Actinomadura] parvosata subsp. kistnae]|uniref:Protein kinase domain-containing protein n=1 Tax=[Actinomadura] parvosata subsp. kistnae TaxID=1909395 RepID=A0A1U9ZUR7_9ACTN|nr:WD40 repeat domain-containing serine/threonine protein kinase [Nonomuraea sp. ATCC 55076]AQZ61694.1 hypothetical protein BKM31_09620 [Nonomuraea sp. ATCC 55076]SPL87801.1 Tyrosine protein kinase:Serine/threonine protein kinase [Actinomadura parvosata subsp. kistnae]
MPEPEETRPDDPERIAGHTVIGRLGEGGQGTVYLATTAGGARVAVKLLRADLAGDAEAAQRFVREVELARRVAPFCTAQVLETGLVEGGRPYIVSEYVDGPTLAEVVRAEGPRTGAALHRLAISTVTALAAIHQAGIVHRDFKPANILLAADGPRVIDFGIARALDLTSTLTGSVVGTPAFMAPEQFGQATPGPPADLFAWAGTMVFAASGRYPFGQDQLPAVIGRILTAEPDVGEIDDPALRALVTDCLAKDPARRPTAGEALARLLGMSPGTTPPGTTPPGTTPPGTPGTAPQEASGIVLAAPKARKVRVRVVAVAVTVAAALTALALALGPFAAPQGKPSAPASAAPRNGEPSGPTAAATFAQSEESFRVPSTTMRVYEDDDDPVKLVSYYGGNGVYIREKGSRTFKRHKEYSYPYVLSPDGSTALALNNYNPDEGPKTVAIIDRTTGVKEVVTLSSQPGVWAYAPRWSPDGKYGLVTLDLPKAQDEARPRPGFAIIDVERATARVVRIEDSPERVQRLFWAGGSVGLWASDGTVRLYDLNGLFQRSLPDAHAPDQIYDDPVSPDGTRLVARCTADGTDLCVRPVSGRGATVTVPFTGDRVMGWWDDDHLSVWRPNGKGYDVVVVDLSGRPVRLLATTTDRTAGLFHFARAGV